MKKLLLVLGTSILLLLFSVMTCSAYDLGDNVTLVYKEATGFLVNGVVKMPVDSEDYTAFENDLATAFKQDVSDGLASIMKTKVANSHIPLKKYGEFLYKTVNKSVSEMSSDLPNIELNGVNIKFNSDRATKAWIESFIKGKLISALGEVDAANEVGIYNVAVSKAIPLSEFKFEDYSGKLDFCTGKVRPLSGSTKEIKTLAVHNTGKAYGLQLNDDFAKLLSGAVDAQGIYERVAQDKFLMIKTALMIPYSVSEDLASFNFTKATDYGVDLKTKTLYDVNASNMGMNVAVDSEIESYFEENSSDFVVFTLSDGTYVAKKTYAEYFKYGDAYYPTTATVDLTNFFNGGKDIKGVLGDKEFSDEISTYVGEDNLFTTQVASTEFMDYAIICDRDNLPLSRLLAYAGTADCKAMMGEDRYKKFAEALKPLCKSAGLTSEYKTAFKSVKSSKPFILIGGVLVILLVVAVIVIVKFSKKANNAFVDLQDTENDEEVQTKTLHHSSKVRGLNSKRGRNTGETISNGMTDETGFTSFEYDDEDE